MTRRWHWIIMAMMMRCSSIHTAILRTIIAVHRSCTCSVTTFIGAVIAVYSPTAGTRWSFIEFWAAISPHSITTTRWWSVVVRSYEIVPIACCRWWYVGGREFRWSAVSIDIIPFFIPMLSIAIAYPTVISVIVISTICIVH